MERTQQSQQRDLQLTGNHSPGPMLSTGAAQRWRITKQGRKCHKSPSLQPLVLFWPLFWVDWGGVETSWALMLCTGVFNDTPMPVPEQQKWHSLQVQFHSDLFFISKIRFWKRKESFRKQGKTSWKARGSFQCASLHPATTASQGASKHLLDLAAAKGTFSQICQTQRIPSLPTALDQLCKASGRLLCWPSSCQPCQTTCATAAWSGTMPRQAVSEELYQQSHSCPEIPFFSGSGCCFLFIHILLVPTPTSSSATPVTPHVTEGLSETLIIFICIGKQVGNSCIKSYVDIASF